MSERTKELDRLEREYRRRKLAIREDPALSWEKKELAVKALSAEYHRAREEMGAV